jgi:glycosyltransferase involved in cell wall biosynthesis
MRILCIIDCLGSGGAQRQMTYLACGLKQRGHDVELFLTHPGADHFRPEIEAAGIPIHGIDRRGHTGFSWRVLLAIRRLLRTGFDGIVSFQLSANGYAVLATPLSLRSRLRVICGERSSTTGIRSRVRKFGVWSTGALSDVLVANSHSQGDYLRRLPGLSRKIGVIWNGYPVPREPTVPSQSDDPLQPRLLVVGRRTTVKNGFRLFEALRIVQDRYGWTPRLRWAGAQQNDPASLADTAAIEALLSEYPHLAQHCQFLGEVNDPTPLYRSSDVLILPSLYEGLPNVVCEAMLAGCPVIASNVCDHPILLGNQERGLLCDPESPASIADAIQRFKLMTRDDRATLASRAHDFAITHLSVNRMIDRYEELLEFGERNLGRTGADVQNHPSRGS